MKILYIHGIGNIGGSSKSLLENLNIIKNHHDIHVITAKGSVVDYFQNITEKVISVKGISKFDNTAYGHYKLFRWLILIREIYLIPFTIFAFYKAKKKWKNFDIIHINEITLILPLILSGSLFNAKIILHARALYWNKEKSFRNKIISKIIKNRTNKVIAIDQNVYESLPNDFDKIIIHNSFTNNKYSSPKFQINNNYDLIIGYVGTISEMKGVFDLLESIYQIKENYKLKVYIAGDTISNFNSVIYYLLKNLKIINGSIEDFKFLIEKYNLEDEIEFLGHLDDMSAFYKTIDVLCFPTHLNAPGRPIFEAASYSTPSIAAIFNPSRDTLINFKTGISYPPKNIEELTSALIYFLKHKNEIKKMGEEAKKLYDLNFNPITNSSKLLNLYNTFELNH